MIGYMVAVGDQSGPLRGDLESYSRILRRRDRPDNSTYDILDRADHYGLLGGDRRLYYCGNALSALGFCQHIVVI